jgi:hypothetical protein
MLNFIVLKALGVIGSPFFLWATRISLPEFCTRRISGTFLVFSLSSFLVQYAANYIFHLKIFRFNFVVYVQIFGDLIFFLIIYSTVNETASLVSIVSQIKPAHILPFYFLRIQINIIYIVLP